MLIYTFYLKPILTCACIVWSYTTKRYSNSNQLFFSIFIFITIATVVTFPWQQYSSLASSALDPVMQDSTRTEPKCASAQVCFH